MMWMHGRADGVDRNLNVATGAVFETNRAGKTGCQFAMTLGFSGAGANSTPGNQVRHILRTDQIKVLSTGRNTHVGQVQQ